VQDGRGYVKTGQRVERCRRSSGEECSEKQVQQNVERSETKNKNTGEKKEKRNQRRFGKMWRE